MSKKNKKAIEEENDLLQKVEKILSLDKSTKDSNDKIFIQYIKFIFTKGFNQVSLSLPVKIKEKESFQFLKNFVIIFTELFTENENIRHKLYQSEISPNKLGNMLFNYLQNLDHIVSKQKLYQHNLANLDGCVNYIFSNYLKDISNTLSGSLNLYFYYIGKLIPSIKSLNLLLYYFLRIDKIFEQYDYEDFCPDLNSPNCLKLIILFFKNVSIQSNRIETLSIYSFLIYKYQYIFKNIEEDIEDLILEKSVNQTVDIVLEKSLQNNIIFQYIYSEFKNNLEKNIESKKTIKKNYEEKEEKKIEESEKLDVNEIIGLSNNQIENKDKEYLNEVAKGKEKIIINEGEINNIKSQEQILNKDGKKENSQLGESREAKNDLKFSKEKDSLYEKSKDRRISQIEEKCKQDEIENDNSKTVENNNNNNGKKESTISNQIINEHNDNSYSEKSSDNTKDDKNDYIKEKNETNNSLIFENEPKSPEIQNLIKEFNKMKIQMEDKYNLLQNEMKMVQDNNNSLQKEMKMVQDNNNSLQKEMKMVQDKNNSLENEMKIMKKEVNQLHKKIEKISSTLGTIQMRDRAKNLLKPYEYLLNNEDIEIIEKDKDKKWELISNKIKGKHKEHEKSDYYPAFMEIVAKSAQTISKGNKAAHHVSLELYE